MSARPPIVFSLSGASRELRTPLSKVQRVMDQLGIESIIFGDTRMRGLTQENVEQLRIALVSTEPGEVQS